MFAQFFLAAAVLCYVSGFAKEIHVILEHGPVCKAGCCGIKHTDQSGGRVDTEGSHSNKQSHKHCLICEKLSEGRITEVSVDLFDASIFELLPFVIISYDSLPHGYETIRSTQARSPPKNFF